jgi:hypothetical protein
MNSSWPELRINSWRDTYATLHLYTQVVGKVRMALTPKLNQWWNVPLYLTTRGLTTSPMPYRDRTLSIDFDLTDHRLIIQDSDARVRTFALTSQPVCDFYHALFRELDAMDVRVQINTAPQECPVTTHFPDDKEHASYDPSAAHQVWQAFRSRFRGKCSPVHLFWGAFDLAVTRFNGRRAPLRAAPVDRDAYDEEVISVGFWPGDPWTAASEAAFYSYTVPEPPGLSAQSIGPGAAFFSSQMKEFLLPYDDVRRSPDPAAAILEFAQSTYDAGATLAGWDRQALGYP